MGFLGPIPADELEALYIEETQTLVLTAVGTERVFTTGIEFTPLLGPSIGDIYMLQGWVGPLTGETKPYKKEQSFKRPLPAGDVIIKDANHMDGVRVPIVIRPWIGEPQPALKSTAASSTDVAIPAITPANNRTIRALFKEPFDISWAAGVPSMGSITMKFDSTFLTLSNAGIQNNMIQWEFNSLKTGNTQVVLTISGGIATFIMQVTFDVFIFVLEDAATSQESNNGTTAAK